MTRMATPVADACWLVLELLHALGFRHKLLDLREREAKLLAELAVGA